MRDFKSETFEEAKKLLEQTGFLVQNIEIRQTTDNFASAEDAGINFVRNKIYAIAEKEVINEYSSRR